MAVMTMKHPIKKMLSTGLAWIWLTILIILLDRYSKIWVSEHLSYLEPFKILPFLNLTLAYNTGAAFSFLHTASGWQNIFLGGFALTMSAAILFYLAAISKRNVWLNISLCLVLGGALGNALDRILYGRVIDFFDFHLGKWHFAIFNIADSAISIGTIMLIYYWLFKGDK